MIDLGLSARDEALVQEARRQARLARVHARDFEYAEDEFLPDAYPEAADCPDVRKLLEEFAPETSGHKIIECLLYIEEWTGGVPLRDNKYSLGNTALRIAGTTEQYEHWKNKLVAIAITEPAGGSDPAATKTKAVYDPATNEWVLNGEKIFISYGGTCDSVFVLTRIVEPDGSSRLSAFMVDRGTPGFTASRQIRKMGIRSEDTAGLAFVDCRIPAFNHIDGNLKKTLLSFSESRPVVASFALGVARAALDLAWDALKARGIEPDYEADALTQPAAVHRLIGLEAEWEATRLTVLRAKWIEQNEGPGKVESSMAKAMGGKIARNATQSVIEILGPEGLSETSLAEKWFRDGRIFDIYEGTGEIQRLIIARHLLDYSPRELN